MKNLLLIDVSSLVYRFFHALPPLTTPRGEPIQAIYGLVNVMLKIFREQQPDYAAAALDRPEKTFREEQFKDYKIHRPPAPDELIGQIKKLPEVFEIFNIKTFELPGYEADDLIGTLARHFAEKPDLRITILSGDLDTLQLVQNDKVVAQIIKTGVTETKTYNEALVVERFGLTPEKLADYKGLIGDASDNIPGVTGIGPKTAVPLIRQFGTIEGIYENLGLINPAIVKKLADDKEKAVLSKKLATISREVPIPLPKLEELVVAKPDESRLKAFLENYGFTSILKRLENGVY